MRKNEDRLVDESPSMTNLNCVKKKKKYIIRNESSSSIRWAKVVIFSLLDFFLFFLVACTLLCSSLSVLIGPFVHSCSLVFFGNSHRSQPGLERRFFRTEEIQTFTARPEDARIRHFFRRRYSKDRSPQKRLFVG